LQVGAFGLLGPGRVASGQVIAVFR
jgi:hypothetical protein